MNCVSLSGIKPEGTMYVSCRPHKTRIYYGFIPLYGDKYF